MSTPEKWRSLKVRDSQYAALAACSEKTGRPIIKLGEEALHWFISKVIPVYISDADRTRATIERTLKPARSQAKKGVRNVPKRTQITEIETVTIAS